MTLIEVVNAIPLGSIVFVWSALAFLIWQDRKRGTIYERTAREIERESAELQARHPKR